MASKIPPAGEGIEEETACVTNTDIENIKKLMQNEITELSNEMKELTKGLVDKTICFGIAEDILLKGEVDTGITRLKKAADDVVKAYQQSIDTAKDVSLPGRVLQTNAPITPAEIKNAQDELNKVLPKHRQNIPSFLFISAPLKPNGSEERKSEEYQRECEAKNFSKEVFGLDSETCRTIKVVDSYAQMLDEIKAFVKDKKLFEIPFVVFLGHGSDQGHLCFYQAGDKAGDQAGTQVHCLQALDDVRKLFKENKPAEMPSWQLRFVFSQCYGHHVDRNDVPGEIKEHGIEYIYVTNKAHEKSTSLLRQKSRDISSLHHIKDTCDLHLKPGPLVLENAVSDVQEQLQQLKLWQTLTSNNKQNISNWLLDGPPEGLNFTVEQVVTERRKKMMMFLLLGYADAESPILFEVFQKHTGKGYGCDIKPVTSEADMSKKINIFLAGAGGEVDIPVIMVTGKGKKQGDQLILQFSETNHKLADTIFKQYRQGNDELRMVFCCYNKDSAGDGGDREVWFTNALPPETVDSVHVELTKYLYAILGDGPKIKNIQQPN